MTKTTQVSDEEIESYTHEKKIKTRSQAFVVKLVVLTLSKLYSSHIDTLFQG